MTIKDLIEKLKDLDQDKKVYYFEDFYGLTEIIDISENDNGEIILDGEV